MYTNNPKHLMDQLYQSANQYLEDPGAFKRKLKQISQEIRDHAIKLAQEQIIKAGVPIYIVDLFVKGISGDKEGLR